VAPFKIVEQFDVGILIQPAKTVQLEKSFLFGGNPIKAEFTVANGGVLFIGQKLFLHVKVVNQSSRSISALFLRLDQFVNMKALNEKKEEHSIERRNVLINAQVQNSAITAGASYDQDLMLEIPPFITGTISHGHYVSRQYQLSLEIELSISGSMTLSVPVTLLEWSPQLKGIVPDKVPISMKRTTEEEKPKEPEKKLEEEKQPEENKDKEPLIKEEEKTNL